MHVDKPELHSRAKQRTASPGTRAQSLSDPIKHGLPQAREHRHGHHGAQAWRIGGLDREPGSKRATERVHATVRLSRSEPGDPPTHVVGLARAGDPELAVAVAVSAQIHS